MRAVCPSRHVSMRLSTDDDIGVSTDGDNTIGAILAYLDAVSTLTSARKSRPVNAPHAFFRERFSPLPVHTCRRGKRRAEFRGRVATLRTERCNKPHDGSTRTENQEAIQGARCRPACCGVPARDQLLRARAQTRHACNRRPAADGAEVVRSSHGGQRATYRQG